MDESLPAPAVSGSNNTANTPVPLTFPRARGAGESATYSATGYGYIPFQTALPNPNTSVSGTPSTGASWTTITTTAPAACNRCGMPNDTPEPSWLRLTGQCLSCLTKFIHHLRMERAMTETAKDMNMETEACDGCQKQFPLLAFATAGDKKYCAMCAETERLRTSAAARGFRVGV